MGVYLPRLNIGGAIAIQVDTGAEVTCLHPAASTDIGISFDLLDPHSIKHGSGVGGESRYYIERAILIFVSDNDDSEFVEVETYLWIAVPTENNRSLESLLGTNVINAWRMNYDPPNDILEFFP